MKRLCTVLTLTLNLSLLFHFVSFAQTGGGGEISSIESKADQILQLEDKIGKLKQEISRQELEREVRIESARKRLADKLEEIDNSESWKNRRNSARSGWEENHPGTCSAGGPPPICTADHWHRVSPSVAWAKYEEYKDEVLDAYHEAIQNAGKAQEDKILELKNSIDQASDDIERLRREIVVHSQDYKTNVEKTGKTRQRTPIRELMQLIAEKHFLEDRIDVYNVKIQELGQEERKTTEEIRDKIAEKLDREKAGLQQKIDENKLALGKLAQTNSERVNALRNKLNGWKSELFDLDLLLRDTTALEPGEYPVLLSKKEGLASNIREGENQLIRFEEEFLQSKTEIEAENKRHSDQIWDYTSNQSGYQDEAAAAVKDAYASKRTILYEGKSARAEALRLKAEVITSKKELVNLEFLSWADEVDKERVRIIEACRKAGCSCYGWDTKGIVVGNWNSAIGCVDTMDSSRYSASGFYGCDEESEAYHQFYAALKGSLSDSDLAALNRSTRKSRYDMLYNRLID